MNNKVEGQSLSPDSQADFLFYNGPDGTLHVEVLYAGETVWLTQKRLAEVFGVEINTINYHLKEVFTADELDEDSVIRKIRITAEDGKKYLTNFYNLDAIISVGYRVNSVQATTFRKWATKVLREYMVKGFAMDDERLKNGTRFGKDYFRELLERVRSIRASERRIWLQLTDIFAEISVDYDKNSPLTHDFYAMVQNKFHYAITGQTAAEIIYSNADYTKDHMGLTVWKNSPDGRILKSDVAVAKNYLSESQIRRLERSVTGFFDYVEDLIEDERVLTMQDFAASIDEFISFRKWKILDGKGKISAERARAKAEVEYDTFNKTQKIISDFDKSLQKRLPKKEGKK